MRRLNVRDKPKGVLLSAVTCLCSTVGFIRGYRIPSALAVAIACMQAASGQSAREFHKALRVSASDPVALDVRLSEGELQIGHGRQEDVSISVSQILDERSKGAKDPVATALAIEQDGNRIRIRHLPNGSTVADSRTLYRIDVPYRTEVYSIVDKGRQIITGVMGPVKAETKQGDIKVSYVSKAVSANAGSGNLDLDVIGERVEAITGSGNVTCMRVSQGARAETGDGDIVLIVVGPSMATVKMGTGRIDVRGARGSFKGSTSAGDLHIRAMPHDDWFLNSVSGNIRVELPPATCFEVDASTGSGKLLIERNDIEQTNSDGRRLHQKVKGGGKHIEVHTDSGKLVIQ